MSYSLGHRDSSRQYWHTNSTKSDRHSTSVDACTVIQLLTLKPKMSYLTSDFGFPWLLMFLFAFTNLLVMLAKVR